MTAAERFVATSVLSGLLVVAAAAVASAQSLPLKRPNLNPITVACPTFQAPAAPVRQQVDEANRLATLAQESALEGDHRNARDLFSQAAALNPRDATLAYRLGREYEEMQQPQDAVRQYCRYLSLAPTAPDAPQLSQRVGHLLTPADMTRGNAVVAAFHTGVTEFDSQDWTGAIASFGDAAKQDTALSAAVYNRALASDRDGDAAAAIRDYSKYVQMEPEASDAPAVRGRVNGLRSSIPSTGTAFALGLIPGGGQFYTHQPVLGVAVVLAVAGGVAFAAHSQSVTRDTMYQDPFGRLYPGTYTQTQHPDLAVGAAAAGGVLLLGAIEAALVAHSRSANVSASGDARSALLPHVGPVLVDLPTFVRGPDGLRWQLPLRIAVR